MKAIAEPDPSWFTTDMVDPETAEFNRMVESQLADAPGLYTMQPRVIREARAAGQSVFGPIRRLDSPQDRVVESPAGRVAVRIYQPEDVKGVYLHFHGGGFVLGQIDQHDEMLDELCRRAQVAVVTVDYRLAPENPYPAAPDDCEAAAKWLVENCRREFGSGPLFIGGESAGANLAEVTLLRMRDRHGFSGFKGVLLNYGVFDLSLTPSARRWGERYLILTTKTIQWFNDNYVPPELRDHPDVSPLYADLRDMPAARFVVGTLDPLIDDSLFMHARWLAAGNRSTLSVYPGGIHAFNLFPVGIGRQANRGNVDFIRAQLDN